MVPEGWTWETLKDSGVSIIDGDRGKEYPKSDDFMEKGYCLFLSAKNVTKEGFKFDNAQFISKDKHERLRKGVVKKGNVVLTTRGTVGQFGLFDDSVRYDFVRINSGMVILETTDSKLHASYLYCLCRSRVIGKQIESIAFGSAQPQLTVSAIKKLKLPVPPAAEQQKIAKILSTWDEAIATTEQLLANSEQQKKALMQKLLTAKKRLPGFEGAWEQLTLGEIGDISSAGVDKKSNPQENQVRLLNYLDVFRREFIFDHELSHTVTAPDKKIDSCNVKQGDVFFTPSSETRNEIALSAVACETMPSVAYSYHVVRLRPRSKLDLNFSAYVFQTSQFRRQAYKAGDGSGQRYVISQKSFRNMEILIPPMPEQQAIGKVLRSASEQIQALRRELELIRKEKKTLMQQLLTGKRRVKIDEAEPATA